MSIRNKIAAYLPVSRGRLESLAERNDDLMMKLAAERAKSAGVPSGATLNYGKFEYEANPLLKGPKLFKTLDVMENDPHVKGSLRSNALPLITGQWEIKPATDDPKDIEIAELVEANLLRTSGETYGRDYWSGTSWLAQRLPEILQMQRDGFALFNLTTKTVGAKRVFDRIQWIEPTSLDPSEPWIIDDEDNIEGVYRTFSDASGKQHAREKTDAFVGNVQQLALYVWDLKGARYAGRSLLRAMYGAWFRKEKVQRWATIWAQKSGAPVPMGTYPTGWTDEQLDDFVNYVKSLRGTSQAEAYGIFPEGTDGKRPEVKFVGAENDVERGMSTLVDSENAEIAHAADTKSKLLGETDSGSRALGDTQQRGEGQSVTATAITVCEFEMHGVANLPGLIESLVDMNYPNVQRYPELVCSSVTAQEDFGTNDEVTKAWVAKLIPNHPVAQRQICEQRFGLELPEEVYEVIEETLPPEEGPPGSEPGTDEEPGAEPPPESKPDEDQPTEAASLADKEAFRKSLEPLLKPVQEGRSQYGGRFPERA